MLQVSPRKWKSRAVKGWAAWCVDTRYALADGVRTYYDTREDAQNYIDQLNNQISSQSKVTDAWKWTLYELAKNYIAFVKKEFESGDRSESYYDEKVRYIDYFLDCVVDGKPVAGMRVTYLTEGMIGDQIMDQLKVIALRKLYEILLVASAR